tara:strand:- start:1044 stop:2387 length:1344 start_codon:yes stop_codon:yes gene_type:complete
MMMKNIHYKYISFFLIILSISSYFIGFIYGENSAGAGGLYGDFSQTWTNLQLFLNNDISTALKLTTTFDNDIYMSSRTPMLYIINKLFNPFIENKFIFIKSIFVVSLLVPILFFLCLKEKFKNEENLLLILISSTVCLSPYFRTSGFWGAEENYGLISLLASFLFLNKFLSNIESVLKDYFWLFLTVLFSSITLYFDQKLAIIPLVCFLQIIFSKKSYKLKFSCVFLYVAFSLPYVYLISLWGNIIPSGDAYARGIGTRFYYHHLGYASTIIAFYLLPLLFYKNESFFKLFQNFLKIKRNYYLISLSFIYLIYLLAFYDPAPGVISAYDSEGTLGKGIVHKVAILLFEQVYLQKILIYSAFIFSWLIIIVYLNNSDIKDKLIVLYFFVMSALIVPIFQEYFDPLIILMVFTFFSSKLFINYKNSIFLFSYLSIWLISANIYYYNLFN